MVISMGTSITLALPTLESTFATSFALLQWVMQAFWLSATALLPIVGRLGDLYGKRTLFLLGTGMFGLGALLCGFAPSLVWLVAFRLLQGVGAALVNGLSFAIVADSFSGSERGKALGVTSAVSASAIVVGPALGGFILALSSWRWVFWANVPLALLVVLATWRYVPKTRLRRYEHFDLGGAFGIAGALATLLIGLSLAQGGGASRFLILGILAVSVGLFGSVVWHERRTPFPLLSPQLFQRPAFALGLINQLSVYACVTALFFLLPFYLSYVLGLAVVAMGVVLSINPVAQIGTAMVSGVLADRFGPYPVVTGALALLGLSFVLLGGLSATTVPVGVVLRLLVVSAAIGLFISPNASAVMGAASSGQTGMASSSLSLAQRLAQSLGVAGFGGFWAQRVAVYAGDTWQGSGPSAPALAQLRGLHETLWLMVGLTGLTLALNLWGWGRLRNK